MNASLSAVFSPHLIFTMKVRKRAPRLSKQKLKHREVKRLSWSHPADKPLVGRFNLKSILHHIPVFPLYF